MVLEADLGVCQRFLAIAIAPRRAGAWDGILDPVVTAILVAAARRNIDQKVGVDLVLKPQCPTDVTVRFQLVEVEGRLLCRRCLESRIVWQHVEFDLLVRETCAERRTQSLHAGGIA